MPDSLNLDTVFAVSEKVVPRKIGEKLIIVPIEDGFANFNDAMFSFNETGARIWECIEQEMNLQNICSTLVSEYNAEQLQIEKGVRKLIHTLIEKGIISEWKS